MIWFKRSKVIQYVRDNYANSDEGVHDFLWKGPEGYTALTFIDMMDEVEKKTPLGKYYYPFFKKVYDLDKNKEPDFSRFCVLHGRFIRGESLEDKLQ